MALKVTSRRLLIACAVLAALAAWSAWQWRAAERINMQIAQGAALALRGALPPEAVFAQAHALGEKGEYQNALALYKQVQSDGGTALKLAARYNSANLFLKQALEMRGEEDRQQAALPLVELAKDGYRNVLKSDPNNWDAKYNLERALRLAPETEDREDAEAEVKNAERAVTTMRGITLGLP
jgi:mxaK protein